MLVHAVLNDENNMGRPASAAIARLVRRSRQRR
jgi:hypothetical protein